MLVLWCWPPVSLAVPGKLYPDLTVSDQNSDSITSAVIYQPSSLKYNAGLAVTDNTSYSPSEIFTNTGNVTLNNYTETAPGFIYLIHNDNSSVNIKNHGDLTVSFGNGDYTYWGDAVTTNGSLENSGDVSMVINRVSGVDFVIMNGLRVSGHTLVNSGNINITGQGATLTNGSAVLATGYGITFTGSQMTNSGDITVVCRAGTNTSTSNTTATASATGLSVQGTVHNTGEIRTTAVGGRRRVNNSSPYMSQDATAYGIFASNNLT
ncbi:MAG: hypothetical protein MI747_14795, partial [Desulfobacterales bacterium]|nr:hypothetical protein [Desulfobacterales bacterium]